MGMLNRAAELGIGTNDRRFPVVACAPGVCPRDSCPRDSFRCPCSPQSSAPPGDSPRGQDPETARPGPEIFARCKIAGPDRARLQAGP